MNKQPFYHRAVVQFDSSKSMESNEFAELLKKIKFKGLVKGTFECDEFTRSRMLTQYEAVILFTATHDASDDFPGVLKKTKFKDFTLRCLHVDAEPGDPSDLM